MDLRLPVLIPHPKQLRHKGYAIGVARKMVVRCAGPTRTRREALTLTRRCLGKLGIDTTPRPWKGRGATGPGYAVCLSHGTGMAPDAGRLSGLSRRNLPPEGYALDIDEGSILIAARDLRGLFYAWQTASQLVVQGGGRRRWPAVSIRDWPDLAIRGAHIDLHNLAPTLPALEERLAVLGGYKINTVLLTYGDKFRFRGHPTVNHPGALTRAEVKRLDTAAADHGIELIPVTQTLGHSANVLLQPRYRSLRERDDVLTQFCPTNPESLALVLELIDEVMDAHRSRFIHIGADETYFLGACPRCRRVAERKGKIGLYLDYVNKVCDHVIRRGRIPLLWDDMLCTSPSRIRRLNRKVQIYYWDYFPADAENPFVFFRNHGWYCNTEYWRNRPWWGGDFASTPRTRDIEEMPGEWRAPYAGYLSDDPEHRTFHPFPFYRFYQDAGFNVVGCSAARGGEYGYHCPNYLRRMSNIRQMTRVVARHRGAGVVTTSWSEMLSPDELTTYLFAAGAEEAWAPGGTAPEAFPERFTRQFFGSDDPGIADAMERVGRHATPLGYTSEERSDIRERGQAADRESLSELLEIRIRAFVNEPGLPDRRAALGETLHDAQCALNLLRRARPSITRNRLTYDHLVLAAETLAHKARQTDLFCRAEELLQRNRRSPARAQALRIDLAKCGRAALRLRTQVQELFSTSYVEYSVQDRDAIVFEGEVEKIKEYRRRLAAL